MIPPIVYRNLVKYCESVVADARRRLKLRKRIASGDLYNSIKYYIDIRTGDFGFMYNEYGKWVEWGRRRNSTPPPVGPIRDWIRQKGLKLNPYAVAKSIGRKGIKPAPFITPAIEKSQNYLAYILEEAIIAQIEWDMNQIDQ